MKLDKDIMYYGAGAGVGVIQTVLMKEYVDKNFGKFPFIGNMLPGPWGYWSTFGNILIGGIAFGLSTFTSIIKDKNESVNNFLTTYGISTLIGGIMNGLFPVAMPAARAATPRRGLRLAPRKMNYNNYSEKMATIAPPTPTGIPPVKVLA